MINKKKLFIDFLFLLLVITVSTIVLNIPVTTYQGINYKVSSKQIPLYIKATSFILRDYNYKEIVKDILKSKGSDVQNALQLFKWTHENIRPVPDGFPVVDDHILNIIIRGYGMPDQSADVFCNLCEYAHIPAQWAMVYAPGSKSNIVLSFVNIEGKWKVFDTYFGNYFVNRNGNLADIEEISNDISLVDQTKSKPIINGIEYREYFKGLKKLNDICMWRRGILQSPFKRLMYEFKKAISKK